jgi:polysaccharide deacetylase 2 family uncharacterized protein YibQ
LAVGGAVASQPILGAVARAAAAVQPAGAPPVIALIIDDVGHNRARLLPFLRLGIPITFSILPHLPFSRSLAERIHADGHEIMLHQPMEPYDRSIDPGPGALYLHQSPAERCRTIEGAIAGVPHARGMNNHMGSRFTESRPHVAETLRLFREREFFFVDSITTCNSVALSTARELHMTTAPRNVFIDNVWEERSICAQLVKLKTHAVTLGQAVGIGHPRPETVRALASFLDAGHGGDFEFAYASQVVRT